MADILYTYKNQVYANITNKCNCRCTFCVRFLHDGLGDAETLWHKVNPTKEQVLAAIDAFDFSGYEWLVFCGYGEPTCELDTLITAARYAKDKYHLKIRLNTNGLGSLENGHDIVPELAEVLDALSISLNAPDADEYSRVTRPTLPGAYEAMLDFTEKCGKAIPDVQMTIVDVLPEEDQNRCRKLTEDLGVRLRIRHYS